MVRTEVHADCKVLSRPQASSGTHTAETGCIPCGRPATRVSAPRDEEQRLLGTDVVVQMKLTGGGKDSVQECTLKAEAI